jgi:hypothetical protein
MKKKIYFEVEEFNRTGAILTKEIEDKIKAIYKCLNRDDLLIDFFGVNWLKEGDFF